MNISTSNVSAALNVERLSATLSSQGSPASDSADSAATLAGSQASSQDLQSHLQSAATALQVSSAHVGDIQTILAQMSSLASAGASATAQAQFTGLQSGLKQSLGATIGGTPLFDGTAGASPYTPDMPSAAPVNLQGGAIGGLVAQDPSGSFIIGAGSAEAADTVSSAQQQASAAAESLAGSLGAVQAAAESAQSQEVPPTLSPSADAWSATISAAQSIKANWSQTLGSLEPSSLQSALGVL